MRNAFLPSLRTSEAGQSAIELALMLPILLLLVTGMVNFGMVIQNYATLTDAVNVAGRQLAVSRGQTTDPCASGSNAVISAAPSLNAANMTFSSVITAYGLAHQYPGTSCSGPNTYSGPPGYLMFQNTVKITVTYPCTLSAYGKSFVPGCTLTASTTEVVQ